MPARGRGPRRGAGPRTPRRRRAARAARRGRPRGAARRKGRRGPPRLSGGAGAQLPQWPAWACTSAQRMCGCARGDAHDGRRVHIQRRDGLQNATRHDMTGPGGCDTAGAVRYNTAGRDIACQGRALPKTALHLVLDTAPVVRYISLLRLRMRMREPAVPTSDISASLSRLSPEATRIAENSLPLSCWRSLGVGWASNTIRKRARYKILTLVLRRASQGEHIRCGVVVKDGNERGAPPQLLQMRNGQCTTLPLYAARDATSRTRE